MRIIRIIAIAVLVFSAPAFGQTFEDCKKITAAIERLDCFDKLPTNATSSTQQLPIATPAKPKLVSPAEDPFITKAKARVKQQLRDPDSARFSDMKVKMVDGKKAVCGMVNAKNGSGGMTGTLPFAYDGEYASLMIFNVGQGNPTSFGSDILGVTLGTRLEAYEKFCK